MAIDKLLAGACRKRHIFGVTFAFENEDGKVGGNYSHGDLAGNPRYYIASINKLIISSLIIRLFHRKELKPNDLLYGFLPPEIRDGLHFYRGMDYTGMVTIKHLLSHTSGLP